MRARSLPVRLPYSPSAAIVALGWVGADEASLPAFATLLTTGFVPRNASTLPVHRITVIVDLHCPTWTRRPQRVTRGGPCPGFGAFLTYVSACVRQLRFLLYSLKIVVDWKIPACASAVSFRRIQPWAVRFPPPITAPSHLLPKNCAVRSFCCPFGCFAQRPSAGPSAPPFPAHCGWGVAHGANQVDLRCDCRSSP